VVWQANEFPDLWHSQNPSLTLRAVVALGRRWDRRVVRKNVDRAVVPDESQARKFKERYGFTPDIIPYGIEYELFAQGNGKQAARLYGLDGSFTVLHTGMISPSKNQLESVQAVEQLRKQVPNIRLVLAGFLDGNDYEQTLRGYVRDHALEHHVVFTGHISKNTLADLYHACNVAVYPVKGQGSWLSPFEVLCAAKPVIVSPSLSSSGIIAEKRIGQVSEDLTRAILNVHENPDLHGEMAQQGRRFVAENLTWEQYSERMLELFQSVLPG
jgi:glycosyltransferase involved in cell wall biosynthesis